MFFTRAQYDLLRELTFRGDYTGYRPDVVEIPNRDGQPDSGKHYSHIAPRYIQSAEGTERAPVLTRAMWQARDLARCVAEGLGLPVKYWPSAATSAIRVLWYPVGASSLPHTDADLFTLNLYRSHRLHMVTEPDAGLVHIGEIGTLVGLGPADMHSVLPAEEEQFSIVYAANLPGYVELPDGRNAGDVLKEMVRAQRRRADLVQQ